MPGDAVFNLERAATWCWARCAIPAGSPLDYLQVDEGWFSLWTPSSAIRMYWRQPDARLAAGGSNWNGLTPTGRPDRHPLHLSVHLHRRGAPGSIYMGPSRARAAWTRHWLFHAVALSPNSALELLAGGSIYASGYAVIVPAPTCRRHAAVRARLVGAPGALGLPLDLLANGSTRWSSRPETPAQIRRCKATSSARGVNASSSPLAAWAASPGISMPEPCA